ncbi:MAG: glutamyl-tRNA amidotransferase [Sulfurovum sp. PC08-66]|jgi:aspartyl-tRNA(Asn)/glutamyl-tRNA(Gln) amidotransferase subunit C|nr:MAG: glutamyl-tRNA amidotransferase [Sulfurovum sp. PC08-66]
MQIDSTILENLEKLSHLHIDEDKKVEIIAQLSDILSYVENLNELDTDHLDASFSTLQGGTPMRSDEPYCDSAISHDILSNAPQSQDDFFIVPAIIE